MAETRMAAGAASKIADPDRPLGESVRAAEQDPRLPQWDQELREPVLLDNELKADPELAEGPASGRRIAVFAIAILVIIGTVFYALNAPSNAPSGTTSTTQSQSQPPAGSSTATPGMTTGAAPTGPQTPASVKPATTKERRRGGTA